MVYLTKSIDQAAGMGEHATTRQQDHARRLHAELSITPCSPRCPVWLLYGVQPRGARHSTTPGRCKGKAHKPDPLGIAGRRVLVFRKWSNNPAAEVEQLAALLAEVVCLLGCPRCSLAGGKKLRS
jgi:hypothetical protein